MFEERINVSFSIDINGILNVVAKDKQSGKSKKHIIKAETMNLTEDEIIILKEEPKDEPKKKRDKKSAKKLDVKITNFLNKNS